MEDAKLSIIVKENELEDTQGNFILSKFKGFVDEFKKIEVEAKAIVVTDPSQTTEMAKARTARLTLKDIRVATEKTRKELKERALKEGKVIDGIANLIKGEIEKIEEYLDTQEKYVENIEKERKAKILAERTLELSKYVENTFLYNYEDMSDEAFKSLVAMVKRDFDSKQEREKKEEEERQARVIANQVYTSRQLEIAPYKFFFGSTEKKLTVDTTEEEFQALLKDLKQTKAEYDKDQEEIKKENERLQKEKEARIIQEQKDREEREKKEVEEKKKRDEEQKKKDEEHAKQLEKERIEKEKIEIELRKKDEEEKKRIEKENKEKEEAAEKERLAKLAPEKEKLFGYAEEIASLRGPSEISIAGRAIVDDVEKKLLVISQEIKLKLKNL